MKALNILPLFLLTTFLAVTGTKATDPSIAPRTAIPKSPSFTGKVIETMDAIERNQVLPMGQATGVGVHPPERELLAVSTPP